MTLPDALREHDAAAPNAREHDGEPVARYVLQAEHHVRAMLRANAPATRRFQRRSLLYLVVIAGVWGFFYSRGPWTHTSVFLVFFAVVYAALAALRPTLMRRQAERLVEGRADLGRPTEIRVAGGEITVDVPGVARTVQRLETLHAVYAEPEGLFIEPYPTEGFFVPAEGFATPADRTAFERALLAGTRIPGPDL